MFLQMARSHRPKHRFEAADPEAAARWKSRALPEVLATLGDFPQKVAPEPMLLAEWEDDGLRRQKWLVDVAPFISATLLVNYPKTSPSGKSPAILCCHGHGAFGKDVVMGDDSDSERMASIRGSNYDYGRQMARNGFVTYAIDWIGFGERNDSGKPNHRGSSIGGRDWCNMYYLHATMLGMTSLSINVAHGKAATDFICTLPEVEAGRLGVMGLSGGGTMALWMTLCDERFLASEIICYSDLWAHFGIRDLNYCGMQVAPGLYKLVDLPELQGLVAPRPLLVDIGAQDPCFKVDSAMECYRQVKRIYGASGAADKLELDLHKGGHAWSGVRAPAFFDKYLKGA
jgi:dienelactone hydrolase